MPWYNRLCRVALLFLVVTSPSAAEEPEEWGLAASIPPDAFFLSYTVHDPEAAWVEAYELEFFQAVLDAEFDQLFLDVLAPTFMEAEDIASLEETLTLIKERLFAIPWERMTDKGFVFAQRMYGDHEGSLQNQAIVGFEIEEGLREVHQGLVGGSFLLRDFLNLRVTIDDGTEVVRDTPDFSDPAEWGKIESVLGTDTAVYYDFTGFEIDSLTRDGVVSGEGITFFSLVFHQNSIYWAWNPNADDYTRDVVNLTRQGGEGLVETERFKKARSGFGSGNAMVYFDLSQISRQFEETLARGWAMNLQARKSLEIDLSDQEAVRRVVLQDLDEWGHLSEEATAFRFAFDLFEMVECMGPSMTLSRVEGDRLVAETVTTLYPPPPGETNPLYALLSGRDEAAMELLNYIPANATSFSVTGGADLGPFYRWLRERVETYIPDSEEVLAVFDGAQAVLALDLEKDLLPLLNSPTMTVSLPNSGGTSNMGGEWVSLSFIEDRDAWDDFNERFVTLTQTLLPFAIKNFKNEMDEVPYLDSMDLTVRPNEGAFSQFHKLTFVSAFGFENVLWGRLGDLSVTCSSEDALTAVLETAAGDWPSILEEGPLQDLGVHLDGEVGNLSYTNVARDIEEIRMALQIIGAQVGIVGGVLGKTMSRREGEEDSGRVFAIINFVGGVLSRTGSVLSHVDYMTDQVNYSVVEDEGRSIRVRSVTRLLRPEDR